MQVNNFGALSAYGLKRTAEDHTHLFETKVVTTIQQNLYVDDCLKSVDTEQEAINLVRG
jgi:hypothetical protein